MCIKDTQRWNRACETNEKALFYIEKIKKRENSSTEDLEFIALFSDLFHSIIKKILKKFKVPNHCDFDDLYQICLITLFNCAKNYDSSNKEAQFLAYLRTAVRNNLITYLRVITHNWKDIMLSAESLSSFDEEK